MTVKMELTRSEVLEIKTSYGTVLISLLADVGLSVGTYTDPESNPVSAVHVHPTGEAVQIHTPDEDDVFTRNQRREQRKAHFIAYLDELDSIFGSPTPEALAEARALFDRLDDE